jgi:predicted ATP-grasp superfamily ATP-dependent carboligase
LANEPVLTHVHHWPDGLDRPVLVLGMEGWIDAGLGGAAAASALVASTSTELVATFDTDLLLDQRARRPVMRVDNGVNGGLTWPEIELRAATNRTGRSLVTLVGPEPDMRWRQFTAEVLALGRQLNVEMVIGLGAFPAPVPHTRPVRLAATASTPELAGRIGYLPATIDVPAGIHASLEHAFASVGIEAVGIWARVPHYVAAMPYPAASAALVDKVAELAGLEVDSTNLHAAAGNTFEQIERLIANSEQHTAMVRQLEVQHDQEMASGGFDLGNLPSGDEMAAELERFLRGEQQ